MCQSDKSIGYVFQLQTEYRRNKLSEKKAMLWKAMYKILWKERGYIYSLRDLNKRKTKSKIKKKSSPQGSDITQQND